MLQSILVTGGAGFIGRNLGALLGSKGYEGRVHDNLTLSNKNVVPKGDFVSFVRGDITDYDA
jgi:nucleoside-diphosphate-sugar epimerase